MTDGQTFLYVGCYTDRSPAGIGIFDATDPTGELVSLGTQNGFDNPSFLTAHPNGRMLYAVSETPAPGSGRVRAYAIDPADGSLTPESSLSTHGALPCHVTVDPRGDALHVANYGDGSVASFALDDDGSLRSLLSHHQHHGSGPTARQQGPHAHCVRVGPDGSLHAVDLGGDVVLRYAHPEGSTHGPLEPAGRLTLEPGTGPRHLAFHPTEPLAFLVGELTCTLHTLSVDPTTGSLSEIDRRSTLPPGAPSGSLAAEVLVHPQGHRIYVSNRGHDTLAVFAHRGVEAAPELMAHIPTGGRTPRHFALHPSGKALLVANQDSDTIVTFAVDDDGIPQPVLRSHDSSAPTCLTFVVPGR